MSADQGPPASPQASATTQQQRAEFAAGLLVDKQVLSLSNVLLTLGLGVVIALAPWTTALDRVDVMVIATLAIAMLAAFPFLGRDDVYQHFRFTTFLAALAVLALLFNAVLGAPGRGFEQGKIPWILPYCSLSVAFFCAYQLPRDALRLLLLMLGGSSVILGVKWYAGLGGQSWPAFIWSAAAMLLLPVLTFVMCRLQSGVHRTVAARILEMANLEAERLQNFENNQRLDPVTGCLTARAALDDLNRLELGGRVVLSALRIKNYSQLRSSRGEVELADVLRQIVAAVQTGLGADAQMARLRGDIILAISTQATESDWVGQSEALCVGLPEVVHARGWKPELNCAVTEHVARAQSPTPADRLDSLVWKLR